MRQCNNKKPAWFKKIMFFIVSASLLTGCGGQKNTDAGRILSENGIQSLSADTVSTDTVSDNNIPQKPDDLDEIDENTAPDISGMTREQFRKLSVTDIKKIVKKYVTDYRQTYGIREDYVMQDDDWENIKLIMEYQLYGVKVMTEEEAQKQSIKAEMTEEEIYYMFPDIEMIENMDAQEFALYFNKAQEYFTDENTPRVDMTQADEEYILNAKEEYLKVIREERAVYGE